MYIREYMTSPVITISSDTLLHDAQHIMYENDIQHLPVVDGGNLVGLITQERLREAEPLPTTGLTMWDLHYSLTRMKVSYVMAKNVVTVTPDTTVEEASVLAQKNSVSALPVVDDKGSLVGIITTTDLYRITTQALGFGDKGVRIHVLRPAEGVVPCDVLEVLCKHKPRMLSIFQVAPVGSEERNLVLHLATEDPGPIVDDITKLGYHVEVRRH